MEIPQVTASHFDDHATYRNHANDSRTEAFEEEITFTLKTPVLVGGIVNLRMTAERREHGVPLAKSSNRIDAGLVTNPTYLPFYERFVCKNSLTKGPCRMLTNRSVASSTGRKPVACRVSGDQKLG